MREVVEVFEFLKSYSDLVWLLGLIILSISLVFFRFEINKKIMKVHIFAIVHYTAIVYWLLVLFRIELVY